MDIEFEYLNYHTEYSCKGDVEHPLCASTCFSKVFDSEVSKALIRYKIIMYTDLCMLEDSESNFCPFTIKQINTFLSEINKITPFTYQIEEKINKELHSFYELTFTYEGDLIYHKYILTWVRYLYEIPFNFWLVDMFKLKELPEYKDISFLNLFAVYQSIFFAQSGHSLFQSYSSYRKIDEIEVKNLLDNHLQKNIYSLHILFNLFKANKAFSRDMQTIKVCGNLRQWDLEQNFIKRKELINNYIRFIYE